MRRTLNKLNECAHEPRPVGPFDRYGVAGVAPRSSRDIEVRPRDAVGKFFQKRVAVMVPAFLPPTFLISAMSDLI
jgi:hypothetical protein